MRGAKVVFEDQSYNVASNTIGELRSRALMYWNLCDKFGFVGVLDHESPNDTIYKLQRVIRIIDADTGEHLLSVEKAQDIDLTKFDLPTNLFSFGTIFAKRKPQLSASLIAKKRRIAAFKDISDAAVNMLYGMCFDGKCDSTLSNYQRLNVVLSHLGASQDEKLLDQVVEFLEK